MFFFVCAAFPQKAEMAGTAKLELSSVEILISGQYSGLVSGEETVESCKDFQLAEADVLAFFRMAERVDQRQYGHDLDASNCYASGTFTASSGATGDWKIDRARRGYLHLKAGGTTYFYCPGCVNELFYEADDAEGS